MGSVQATVMSNDNAWQVTKKEQVVKHKLLEVSAEQVVDVVTSNEVSEEQRRKAVNSFFTRRGNAIASNPAASVLYYDNPVPPDKVLRQRQKLDLKLASRDTPEYIVDNYVLQFWNSTDFEQFRDILDAQLRLQPDDVLLYCSPVKLKTTTSSGAEYEWMDKNRHTPKPPLSNFLKEGQEYEFVLNSKTPQHAVSIRASVVYTSTSLATGSETQRKTGYVVLRNIY